jgi:hypothetical protein
LPNGIEVTIWSTEFSGQVRHSATASLLMAMNFSPRISTRLTPIERSSASRSGSVLSPCFLMISDMRLRISPSSAHFSSSAARPARSSSA